MKSKENTQREKREMSKEAKTATKVTSEENN